MSAELDRRTVLTAAAALAAVGGAAPALAQTAAGGFGAAAPVLRQVFGDRPVREGRVLLKLPVVAENGGSVQVTLGIDGVELPKRLILIAPDNPQALATEIRFGPRAAKAGATMRVRLARSQRLVAAAEMADGTVWATGSDVTITSGACIELGE